MQLVPSMLLSFAPAVNRVRRQTLAQPRKAVQGWYVWPLWHLSSLRFAAAFSSQAGIRFQVWT